MLATCAAAIERCSPWTRRDRAVSCASVSTIHLIGGEKGGVGKSVVARLLAQYCIDNTLPFVAMDADGSNGTLLRYYRDYARPVDLSRFESADEILLLASEDPNRRVVVDLPAQSERPLWAWIGESGVLSMASELGVSIVFWHVMGEGKESVLALERLLAHPAEGVHYCLVRNYGRGKDFSIFDNSEAKRLVEARGATVIDLADLHGPAMQKIDRFDASFWAAAHNPLVGAESITRMERQRIGIWLRGAYEQIGQLGMRV
jgi:hypothetical protein